MVIVIPVRQPDAHLADLVHQLRQKTAHPILVVDDGSSPDLASAWEAVKQSAVVLRHDKPCGRGRAVKTALTYAASHFAREQGIVVADADGSVMVSDIEQIGAAFAEHPEALLIGFRSCTGKKPLHKKIGDTLFRYMFAFASGIKLGDARSGLRAYSMQQIPDILGQPGEDSDYDMAVLLDCIQRHVPVVEVPLEPAAAVSPPAWPQSFWKSLRIYSVILKYTGVAVLSFLIDYTLFRLFYFILNGFGFSSVFGISAVRIGNVAARIVSSTINFTLNRQLVFKDRGNLLISALKYYTLVVFILLINTCLLMFLNEICGIPAGIAKLLTEVVLFTASMLLQRLFVFRNKAKKSGGN